jgi:hypothetical protein
MFMFVVYTSRVKGKALAAKELKAEPAAEDGSNFGGGVVAGERRVVMLQLGKKVLLETIF